MANCWSVGILGTSSAVGLCPQCTVLLYMGVHGVARQPDEFGASSISSTTRSASAVRDAESELEVKAGNNKGLKPRPPLVATSRSSTLQCSEIAQLVSRGFALVSLEVLHLGTRQDMPMCRKAKQSTPAGFCRQSNLIIPYGVHQPFPSGHFVRQQFANMTHSLMLVAHLTPRS